VLVLAGRRQHAAHHDALLALRALLPAASMQPSGPDLYLSASAEKKKDAVRLRAFPFARGHDVSLELLASAISQGLLILDSPVRLAKKQAMQLASSMFKPRALQALCPPGMRLIVVQLPIKAAMCAAERRIPPGSSVQQINSIAISSEGHAPCVEPARSWQTRAPARELAREPARETEQRSVLGGFLKDMYEDTSSSSSSITSESTDSVDDAWGGGKPAGGAWLGVPSQQRGGVGAGYGARDEAWHERVESFPSHPMRSGTSVTSSLTNSVQAHAWGAVDSMARLEPVLEMENPHAYSPMPAQHRLAPALEPKNPHAYNPMPQHWHARQDEHELAPLQHQHAPQDELSLTSPLRVARESRPTNVSSDSEAGCVVDFSDWLDDLVPGEEDGGGGDNNKAPKRDLAEQCSVS
jgi:hypothetical protein